MKNHNFTMILAKTIGTTFGFGYWPWGPGTAGAIAGVAVWIPLWLYLDSTILLAVTGVLIVVFTILGVWAGNQLETIWGKDPSKVVMDETVGVWINLLPVGPIGTHGGQWWWILTAFVLFRAFDIIKPLGIRRLERLGGGLGIMADDIAAGALGAVMIIVARFIAALFAINI